ncbi:MAG: M28 family peptidase [Flavobacteriales bacterium]|nr:M28 family peptidase [Flavobacteriales bacterium]
MVLIGNWGKASFFFALLLAIGACNPNKRIPAQQQLNAAPDFQADSAYAFIKQQLAFGPRVPGTESHKKCGDHLVKTFKRYGFAVSEQVDSMKVYTGYASAFRNIIASSDTARSDRVLLFAHWDSRKYADRDVQDQEKPISGANDNASGVAVLLEMARLISERSPEVGVDIVLFDLEDQGRPATDVYDDPYDHGFCRGSWYWSERVDSTGYRYGILLDMVGAKDAIFTLDATSMEYAPDVVYKVWDMGHQLGYGKHFQYNRTWEILDDHVNVNLFAHIPCIDIVQHDAQTESRFANYWHTHSDNIDVIDRETLKAVGQTVMQIVYNE